MASTPFAIVARLDAKPEKASEVEALLRSAESLAQNETGTIEWYAVRSDDTTFWIFDTFADEAGRTAHLEGEIARALMANADALLATPPQIMPADVLARI